MFDSMQCDGRSVISSAGIKLYLRKMNSMSSEINKITKKHTLKIIYNTLCSWNCGCKGEQFSPVFLPLLQVRINISVRLNNIFNMFLNRV